MGQIARTVEDVVLGEATYGTRQERFEDMVAIASVIENRARGLSVTHLDVVADRREFNAYGKALPSGVEKHRDLARKAIEQVQKYGPVHNATFYATPAAAKNLPSGLKSVTETKGHQYFVDPQNRAIRTAQGFRVPDPVNIAGAAPETLYDITPANVPTPSPRPDPGILSSVAPEPVSGLGLAALASPTDLARVSGVTAPAAGIFDFNPPSSAVRNMAVNPELTGLVQGAISRMGPEYGFQTTSGGQPAKGTSDRRVGSVRHDLGMAIDGTITKNGVAIDPVNNRQEYMDALTNLAEAGVGGLGHYGWGIHADIRSPNAWGPTTSRASLDPGFAAAIDQGRALSRLDGNYPTPIDRSGVTVGSAQNRSYAAPNTAPVGRVDRGGLLASPTAMPGRSQVDPRNYQQATQRAPSAPVSRSGPTAGVTYDRPTAQAMPGRSQVTPSAPPAPSMPGRSQIAPSVAPSRSAASRNVAPSSITGGISMPSAPPSFGPSAAQRAELTAGLNAQRSAMSQPANAVPSSMANAYGQLASTMGQVGVMGIGGVKQYDPLQGVMTKAYAPPPSVAIMAPPPAPVQVAPPPRPVQPAVVNAPRASAPSYSAPSRPPAASAQDVWSGRAQTGIATNGNTVSRNPDGTISMTSSRYGYTETMNPDGSFRSTTAPGLFGLDRAVNNALGGIAGPVGGTIGQSATPSATQGFGARAADIAKGAAGAWAGSMAGGLLGPVGSVLGAIAGKDLARGKNPLGPDGTIGGLFSRGQSVVDSRGFPDAPSPPVGLSNNYDPNRDIWSGATPSPGGSGITGFGDLSPIDRGATSISVSGPGGLY